jgi:hypothetical protein
LIEATTDRHLWADKFDGPLEDVFGLQDQVTSSVVGLIAPKLEQAEMERAAASQLLKLQPDFRASFSQEAFPVRFPDIRDRMTAALIDAGLPE